MADLQRHGVVRPVRRLKKTRPDVTVGKLLAEARRRRNLSLAAAAQHLCIPERQLRGLEDGDLSVFPAEVYARGAFTTYAEYLGVQAEATQRAFLRVLSGSREFAPLRVHRPKSWLASHITPRWILAMAISLVAFAVGAYVIWQVGSYVWLPALTVESLPGVVHDMRLPVRGTVATNAVVFVNDIQILPGEDGHFATELVLHQGINVIQIKATNAAGRTTHITKDVLLARQ